MHLELMRLRARDVPLPHDTSSIRSARVWHCGFESLAPLRQLQNLRTLVVASYPDNSLEPLAHLTELRFLTIVHFPRVDDLAPLRALRRLRSLSLTSLPSWDASGRVLTVRSFEPLAGLTRLRHLELFGVRPAVGGLHSLFGLTLETARISKIEESEVQEFFARTGAVEDFNPDPVFGS